MRIGRISFISRVMLALLITAEMAAGGQAMAAEPEAKVIPAGSFMRGSGRAQREAAYHMDEVAYGHSRTRAQQWYENEFPYGPEETGGYVILRHLVTNREYQAFVMDTGHPSPDVTSDTWQGYGLIHPFSRTRRHAWQGQQYPQGRADHPVVLVSVADAEAYAQWLSEKTGQPWRLPVEAEWERAARGDDGRWFPWGNEFDAVRLNSHDRGPFDTLPVGHFVEGQSPFGVMDMAGQVFEWTATAAGPGRRIVKGGSWDDKGCGICRAAARHSRPEDLKHILVGFRLVRDLE
ncbi:formylglycine-generating enzyme family protein [Aestuariispira insulae]|uniref:Formylglycine-generating enzyme required for sulfatase activity n=1 Tax=Aestuariispira insulae TaxID=1461337 RepID=A0A3D9HHD0_9PROT|nr:SUMF1/EgtB/PvdO family nonheme iron enzyme [Aestuariispira insulae]RED48661.1 formylglycine-generating enzyme required for sulfatase activity [Aestuariispira insulae]